MSSSSVPSDPNSDPGIASISEEIRKKDTTIGIAWRAASEIEINDNEIKHIDIRQTCESINQIPTINSTMPIKSVLLGGAIELLKRKVDSFKAETHMPKEDMQKSKDNTRQSHNEERPEDFVRPQPTIAVEIPIVDRRNAIRDETYTDQHTDAYNNEVETFGGDGAGNGSSDDEMHEDFVRSPSTIPVGILTVAETNETGNQPTPPPSDNTRRHKHSVNAGSRATNDVGDQPPPPPPFDNTRRHKRSVNAGSRPTNDVGDQPPPPPRYNTRRHKRSVNAGSKATNDVGDQPTPPPPSDNTRQHTLSVNARSRTIRRRVKTRKRKFVLPATCLQQKTYDDVCRTQWMTSVVKEYLNGVNLRNASCEDMTARLTASHKRYRRLYLTKKREDTVQAGNNNTEGESGGEEPSTPASDEGSPQDSEDDSEDNTTVETGGGRPPSPVIPAAAEIARTVLQATGTDNTQENRRDEDVGSDGWGDEGRAYGGDVGPWSPGGYRDIQATSSTAKDGDEEQIKEKLRLQLQAKTDFQLELSALTAKLDKKDAATLLRVICELASAKFIKVEQPELYGAITISKGSNFS